MFEYTLDRKEEVTDANGNRIIDLTKSIFTREAGQIQDYTVVKMTDIYQMRPDLISQYMYGTDEYTEFILKFAGISNPFTLHEDDILLIPNITQAKGMMEAENRGVNEGAADDARMVQIRNFYKFVNTEYKPDRSSYDKLKNMDIPSGVIDTTKIKEQDYIVPYISEDGRTSVTIRNNRIYFGDDSGMQTADQVGATSSQLSSGEGITKSVQSIIRQAQTAYSEKNCLYNGMSVADMFRSNQKNNK